MNGHDVRTAKFARGRVGYDPSQVHQLLADVADELDAGRPAWPVIATARRRMLVLGGSDRNAVDAFLDQVIRQDSGSWPAEVSTDPWQDRAVWNYTEAPPRPLSPSDRRRARKDLALDCARAWRDFREVPGVPLTWMRTEDKRRELVTADRQVIASFRRKSFTVNGRDFQVRPVLKADRPRVARAFSLPGSSPSANSWSNQVVDSAGQSILFIAGAHLGRSAGASIKFTDHRVLRFPVRGTQRFNAIMTAVDQDGTRIARFRRLQKRPPWDLTGAVEIMVHPGQRLTYELALVIALAAPWVGQYFTSEPGGGG